MLNLGGVTLAALNKVTKIIVMSSAEGFYISHCVSLFQ